MAKTAKPKFINNRPSPASQALMALPPRLQALVKTHPYAVDQEELIQNVWASLLDAQAVADGDAGCVDYMQVFNRARSNTRRYGQDYCHFAQSLEDVPETELMFEATDYDDSGDEPRYKDYVARVAKERGVSLRRAQQLLKEQLDAVKATGSLF